MPLIVNNQKEWGVVKANDPKWSCKQPEPALREFPVEIKFDARSQSWTWVRFDAQRIFSENQNKNLSGAKQ